MGIAIGGQSEKEEEMEYVIGATNFVDVNGCNHIPPQKGMTEYSYPSAKWVIINADGELQVAVQQAYKQFYSEWLPSSGYQLADLPVIECYKQENNQEVWIAIEEVE